MILQSTGLSVQVFNPLVRGGDYIEDISAQIEGYSHELGADGGCLSASIQMNINHAKAQDWYSQGLGRVIKVFGPSGNIVFQGFVNLLTLAIGALSGETRGPLLDLANRASAVYTPIDTSVYPPVSGTTTVTVIGEDTDSQALYGIIEKVLSAGTCTDDDATYARNLYLRENAYPSTSGEVSPEANADISLSLDILGFSSWLPVYIYNDETTGFITYTDKIKAVLTADPNGFISSDQSGIGDNLLITYATEDQNRDANTIISAILARGDVSDNRWLFGVDENRKAYYRVVPSDILYTYHISDERQRVMYSGGGEAYPWEVKPGQWIRIGDMFVDGIPFPGVSSKSDKRLKFIETVRFTAPYGLSLTGGNFGTLTQLLAKFQGGE